VDRVTETLVSLDKIGSRIWALEGDCQQSSTMTDPTLALNLLKDWAAYYRTQDAKYPGRGFISHAHGIEHAVRVLIPVCGLEVPEWARLRT